MEFKQIRAAAYNMGNTTSRLEIYKAIVVCNALKVKIELFVKY